MPAVLKTCLSCSSKFEVVKIWAKRIFHCKNCREKQARKKQKEKKYLIKLTRDIKFVDHMIKRDAVARRQRYVRRILTIMIRDLGNHERYAPVIEYRKTATLEKCGEKFGVSRERVRQIERDYS